MRPYGSRLKIINPLENKLPTKNWKEDFKYMLEDFVDRFVVMGADRNEVLDMISVELENLRSDFDLDPDPSEEGTPPRDREPANDWPGAES